MTEVENGAITFPGRVIGSLDEYSCGIGVYEKNGDIIAAVVGKIVVDETEKRLNVVNSKCLVDLVPSVNDIVLCQVTRIQQNNANVEILVVGDRQLRQPSRGVIRREDVRLKEIDKVVMIESFHPGDLVKAAVISLGDSNQYFLSTADVHLGVCYAKSDETGHFLKPVSWMVSWNKYFAIFLN